uniref:Uncharacterized protein n=1 Tax=Chromera velia CCMP2878 TaxID=1169474 RepID=A0A0G4FNY8_9ALVE|eukprot:Cvel_17994.t1-p1 / transcript=Cvel_17994.t1 / gene=Cvel_17994 / organism=Chromera_velia_CCMP2878 / gene_product=hypothetical protein / transcript_product=hypothetical protein / location=Cvel_scaffold1466:36684-44315(-) / protein_length=405 / sequence_SO=supercontig / SO=protein_coding / is_pseudo=false
MRNEAPRQSLKTLLETERPRGRAQKKANQFNPPTSYPKGQELPGAKENRDRSPGSEREATGRLSAPPSIKKGVAHRVITNILGPQLRRDEEERQKNFAREEMKAQIRKELNLPSQSQSAPAPAPVWRRPFIPPNPVRHVTVRPPSHLCRPHPSPTLPPGNGFGGGAFGVASSDGGVCKDNSVGMLAHRMGQAKGSASCLLGHSPQPAQPLPLFTSPGPETSSLPVSLSSTGSAGAQQIPPSPAGSCAMSIVTIEESEKGEEEEATVTAEQPSNSTLSPPPALPAPPAPSLGIPPPLPPRHRHSQKQMHSFPRRFLKEERERRLVAQSKQQVQTTPLARFPGPKTDLEDEYDLKAQSYNKYTWGSTTGKRVKTEQEEYEEYDPEVYDSDKILHKAMEVFGIVQRNA